MGLIDHHISELSRLAQEHYPQAAIEVLPTLYEDEDAHIVVFLPEGICESESERLREMLTKRSTEILLDAGLLILAGVYETSQQP
jgi:hypothetical protein